VAAKALVRQTVSAERRGSCWLVAAKGERHRRPGAHPAAPEVEQDRLNWGDGEVRIHGRVG
jgi:hypothetical protein